MLLFGAALLAGYQIAVGIDGLAPLPVAAYTIAFGILLVADLLLVILGFEVLDSRIVVVLSTLIPLGRSLGLIAENLPGCQSGYLAFAVLGLAAVLLTRLIPMTTRLPLIVLVVVHSVAGLTISLLPIASALAGRSCPGFALVGLGGALIGLAGLMLSFQKAGRPLLAREVILRLLPGLLFLMTAAFVAGFRFD